MDKNKPNVDKPCQVSNIWCLTEFLKDLRMLEITSLQGRQSVDRTMSNILKQKS